MNHHAVDREEGFESMWHARNEEKLHSVAAKRAASGRCGAAAFPVNRAKLRYEAPS